MGGCGGSRCTQPRKLLGCALRGFGLALSGMAKLPLLLLLPLLALAGGPWPRAQAQAAPYAVKLCGREFIRAVIFTCGGSRWRRSDVLAHEAMDREIEAQRTKSCCSPLKLKRLNSRFVSLAPRCRLLTIGSSINKQQGKNNDKRGESSSESLNNLPFKARARI
ncbi:relaxin-3 isoform X2 [Choloepus didactylus]|uniref:relaxin-3 isoform X2 n=1 Tax=Choloepus didactylus TaxID=27675 RepID=UPI00189FACD7|nr:relaxin-3 isoform X2 [Choloepus didactylus]